jgi:hypothetical protein
MSCDNGRRNVQGDILHNGPEPSAAADEAAPTVFGVVRLGRRPAAELMHSAFRIRLNVVCSMSQQSIAAYDLPQRVAS